VRRFFFIDQRILIVLLLLPVIISGNPASTLDSLLKAMPNMKEDTIKVRTLLQISEEYSKLNFDSAAWYNQQAYRLSVELDDQEGTAFSYFLRGSLYYKMGNLDSAYHYSSRSVKIASSINNHQLLGENYNLLGSVFRKKGYSASGLEFYKNALESFKKINDSSGIGNAYNRIGLLHKNISNYDSAIAYLIKAERIFSLINDKYGIVKTLINQGDCYLELKDYEKSQKLYHQSLRLCKNNDYTNFLALTCNDLGKFHLAKYNYDSAYYYFNMALETYEQLGNSSDVGNAYLNLGALFIEKGQYAEANQYFNRCLALYDEMKYTKGIINVKINQAVIHERKGDYDKALLIYDTTLKLAMDSDDLYLIRENYYNIFKTHKLKGSFADAFKYQTKYYEIKDSIFNLERMITIDDLNLKYEKEKDQARILALENENLLKDLDLKRKTNQQNIYLFVGLGIILIITFSLIYIQLKARKDKIIAHQRIKQLEEEKKFLAARLIVEGQEKERKRIAQELHDGLGVLLSTARMQFSTITQKSPEARPIIEKAAKLLEQATGDVRKISHNMMPGLLTKYGLFEAVQELFDQVDKPGTLNARVNIEGIKARLPENTEIMIYRVVQEMLNNSLKHSNARNISLFFKINSQKMNLQFSDDGQGFDVEKKLEEKSIGLNSIYSRVNFLDGEITIESEPKKGTKYFIQIPLKKTNDI
jgi:signal transduction histidine kinase